MAINFINDNINKMKYGGFEMRKIDIFTILIIGIFIASIGAVSAANNDGLQIKVISDEPWTATVDYGDGVYSYACVGNKTIDVSKDNSDMLLGYFHKNLNTKELLKVEVLYNGEVISQNNISAPYGTVTVMNR